MDVLARLTELGFERIVVLEGSEWGVDAPTLILAMMTYVPQICPDGAAAHIHPYYFVSQRAYRAAEQVTREAQAAGVGLYMRDEIRVKPIFARLPGFSQGRNTLSYMEDTGSRFHVQVMTLDQAIPPTHHPETAPHDRHCGSCTLCMSACPTHAIDEQGFHRERCLRNWQLGGKPVPQELRSRMGARFIGCDECQRCCPHNVPPEAVGGGISLAELLQAPKETAAGLKEQIGANLAIPNRVLAQALLNTGCSADHSLLPAVEVFCGHPSPVVAEHAAWAAAMLKGDERP